jgi:HEAT repeat protein
MASIPEMTKKQDKVTKSKPSGTDSPNSDIPSLVAELANKDGMARVKARCRLVGYKAQAVAPLIQILTDKKDWVRWEAAKALSQIGNPASIQALLDALTDKSFEVRWLAADGLIRIGRKSIIPSLKTLVTNSDSYWLREGIYHVLHDINKGNLTQVVQPVLASLEGPAPSLVAPPVAKAALDTLTRKYPTKTV